MNKEEWRIIPSWPLYEASSLGRVRRRAIGRYYRNPGKPKVQNENSNGYFRVSVDIDGIIKQPLVNRMVCEAFNGPAPTPRHTAAHRDGNRKNNLPENLTWLTRKENYQDQIVHGTSKRGSGNSMAKLKPQDVLDIRSYHDVNISNLSFAFGVTPSCIRAIIARRTWRHL